jgi:hypothetical protein
VVAEVVVSHFGYVSLAPFRWQSHQLLEVPWNEVVAAYFHLYCFPVVAAGKR